MANELYNNDTYNRERRGFKRWFNFHLIIAYPPFFGNSHVYSFLVQYSELLICIVHSAHGTTFFAFLLLWLFCSLVFFLLKTHHFIYLALNRSALSLDCFHHNFQSHINKYMHRHLLVFDGSVASSFIFYGMFARSFVRSLHMQFSSVCLNIRNYEITKEDKPQHNIARCDLIEFMKNVNTVWRRARLPPTVHK